MTDLIDSPTVCRDSSAPLGDRVGVPRGGTGISPTLPCRGAPTRKNRPRLSQGFGLRAVGRPSGPNPRLNQGFGLRAVGRPSGPNPRLKPRSPG
jgi:hypothetical protein